MRACESAKDGTASSEHAKAASVNRVMLNLRCHMVIPPDTIPCLIRAPFGPVSCPFIGKTELQVPGLSCRSPERGQWEARRVPQSLNTVRGSPWKSRKLASIEFLVSSWVPYTRTGG